MVGDDLVDRITFVHVLATDVCNDVIRGIELCGWKKLTTLNHLQAFLPNDGHSKYIFNAPAEFTIHLDTVYLLQLVLK